MDKDKIIALWEQHLGAELFAKDIDATMATMTGDPYVNHVPTMTGGVGAAELRRFYAHHFISRQPNDFEVVPVSRTVGEETLIDEMVARFTHSCRMAYFLPLVAPTHRKIDVPLVLIAHFRDGRLAHEHIYWDQASVLVQVGWLAVEGLPIAGAEVAQQELDRKRPRDSLMFIACADGED